MPASSSNSGAFFLSAGRHRWERASSRHRRGSRNPRSRSLVAEFHQRCGLGNGKVLEQDAFTSVKIAAFAPIPSARVNTAVAVKPGVLRNWRIAKRGPATGWIT